MARVRLLGAVVDDVTFDEAVDRVALLARDTEPRIVVTPNVDHVVRLHNDADFRRLYKQADLVLADGMPLLWASRILGRKLKEKVSGSDLFPAVCERAAQEGLRVFLMGGRSGAAEKAAETLVGRYPKLIVCGTYCPPMGFDKNPELNKQAVDAVRAAKPDILFVGLGSPKQERWMTLHKQELRVPVSIGVGVSFEFTAGLVQRAPVWMQKTGLEWFWRLVQEPGRLWKRYLIDDLVFFRILFLDKLGRLP